MVPCAWVILPWFLAAYPYLPLQLNIPSLKGSSPSAHKARWGGRWRLTSPSPGLVWHIPALGGWLKPPPCPHELGEWGQSRAWEGQVSRWQMSHVLHHLSRLLSEQKRFIKVKTNKKKLQAHLAAPASLFSSLAFSHFSEDPGFLPGGVVLRDPGLPRPVLNVPGASVFWAFSVDRARKYTCAAHVLVHMCIRTWSTHGHVHMHDTYTRSLSIMSSCSYLWFQFTASLFWM